MRSESCSASPAIGVSLREQNSTTPPVQIAYRSPGAVKVDRLAPLGPAASSLRRVHGGCRQRRCLAQFRFNQGLIARWLGAFDCRDVGRAAIAPLGIGVAGLDTHCFGNELNPVP